MATVPATLRHSEDVHRAIHGFACEVVIAAVHQRELLSSETLPPEIADLIVHGVYVSLKRADRLRGCCGSIGSPQRAALAIADAGRRTALEDPRFPPVAPDELPYLELETWLLGPAQPVPHPQTAAAELIEIGRHGLHIRRGANRGLLLPGVAVEHGLDAVGFLEQVCVKAQLPRDAWHQPDTELAIFEADSWRAPLNASLENPGGERVLLPKDDLKPLQSWVAANIYAAWCGATPQYYLAGVQDTVAQFAAVLLVDRHGQTVSSTFRCAWRPPMPVQATLFQVAAETAEFVQDQGIMPEAGWSVELVLGHDMIPHGEVERADLRGFDADCRALMIAHADRLALVYQSSPDSETMIPQLLTLLGRDPTEAAAHDQLFSLKLVASSRPLTLTNTPRVDARRTPRAPAVAGVFYPASDTQIRQQLTELFRGFDNTARRSVAAAMVPHAGWKYSGRIAAEVLARIEIPETVVVIGPKHTRRGVDYAIAPCDAWQLPSGDLLADAALAAQLAEQVPGWQLDAAAHAQEHGLEVELPLLAHLRPDVRIVGVALGAASFARCEQFAEALAGVLRDRLDRVLLLISSDMNHYAADAENRRLDAIALEALETCDPAHAFQRIRDQRISMCGLVPATVVMLALRRLGRLQCAERVAYATSAEATGDTSRVVGYAGMLLLHR